MIVVKVELWPHGAEDRAREIGRTYIANTGGTVMRGNYTAAVCRKGRTAVPAPLDPNGPEPTRTSTVADYPRQSYTVWRLLIRALLGAFPEETPKAAKAPELPELPPGYTVGECEPGDWVIYARGDYCDGVEEKLETREQAVAKAWELWDFESCDQAWRDFLDGLGG